MLEEKTEDTSKIVLVGDCHGRFEALDKILTEEEPDFFLSTGDIGILNDIVYSTNALDFVDAYADKGYFVYGNHDDCEPFHNLTIEQDIRGIKVAALNGMLKTRTFLKELPNNISFKEVIYLSHRKDVDILVTHQPPLGLVYGAGEEVLRDLFIYMAPKIYISGHIHKMKYRFLGQSLMITLPMVDKGYAVAYFQGNDLKNIEIVFKKGKKVIRI